jgi:lysophospholipase L1-like esterase
MPSASSSTCSHRPSAPTTSSIQAIHGQRENALAETIASQSPLDLVILALGQNDLRDAYHRSPLEVGLGALHLVTIVEDAAGSSGTEYPAPMVLLIAPPPMPPSVAEGPFKAVFGGASAKSTAIGPVYARLAQFADIPFLDAGTVTRIEGVDSVHLTPAGHAALGKAVAARVKELLPAQP